MGRILAGGSWPGGLLLFNYVIVIIVIIFAGGSWLGGLLLFSYVIVIVIIVIILAGGSCSMTIMYTVRTLVVGL